MNKPRIGLIVNPIAGMGGRVGLKGTDGPAILARAKELGASPVSGIRASITLEKLLKLTEDIELTCAPGDMGETIARAAGFTPEVVGEPIPDESTRSDTIRCAKQLKDARIDLLLFAGGDGTARDLVESIGMTQLVLGIPAGVKIHSAVYARTPDIAAHITSRYLRSRMNRSDEAEVLDIDEDSYRKGQLRAKLYGYLRVPVNRHLTQGLKSGSPPSDQLDQGSIAEAVIDEMKPGCFFILGPGSTTAAITEKLGLDGTLLGVDLLLNRELVGKDMNESKLLAAIGQSETKIVLTPIGGQGFILGRGNQQISPTVLRRVGKDNLIIISTKRKIQELRGRNLLIDTGDDLVDKEYIGFYKVITGYHDRAVYKVG
ncbi:ATP-NAD kinase family protein [Candidatus Neomarinimicrobiota bacterium]